QVTGAMADDEGARFVIRLPATGFTGRLIVGVPAATRSKYTGDFVASDPSYTGAILGRRQPATASPEFPPEIVMLIPDYILEHAKPHGGSL
ncbi:MAG: hypothetical protein H7138_19950, partial [Myxococcales bacterium]|nr:hypothetical protein [Myxococcales bacterium]